MAYDQIIQDFTLNAKRVTDSMEEERQWAIEWMNKFEESEQALNTCFQILQASIDDDVNLICVKILQNKIKNTSRNVENYGFMKIYDCLMDLIKKSSSLDLITQICICLINMIARTDILEILPLLVVHDIMSIMPEDVASQHDSSDLFLKHKAVVFLRQLFTYFSKSENTELNDLKSKVQQDGEPIQQLFVDFLQAFQASPVHLHEIIESCRLMVYFFSETNNMEWKIVVTICDILLKADPEQTDLVYACLRFIKTYVRYFQPPNEEEYMRRYQYFSVLVQDLYPIIGAAIGRKNEKILVAISGALSALVALFLETHIKSVEETNFMILDELIYVCQIENIYVYFETIKLWLEFKNHLHLSDNPKFTHFSVIYCNTFVNQMMNALILSQPILDEYYKNAEDNFVVEFRDEIQNCLHTVFKVIEPGSYFARALLTIRVNSDEFSKIEPSLFLITSMITASYFLGDLKEIMDIILNFPPNIPLFLIHTSCLFLNKYIYYQVDNKKYDDKFETMLASIYRWLSRIPLTSRPHLDLKTDSDKIEQIYRISSITNKNERPLFNSLITVIRSLVIFLESLIKRARLNERIAVLHRIMDFHSKIVHQEVLNTLIHEDSIRFVLYALTCLVMFMECIRNPSDGDYCDIGTACLVFVMCLEVFLYLKDNEEICEKACSFMSHFILFSKQDSPYFERLSEQLLQYYQSSGYSCFMTPFISIHKTSCLKRDDDQWLLRYGMAFYEQTFKFIGHQDPIVHHPNHVRQVLKLSRQMFEWQFDDTLHYLDIGMILSFASEGLLSEEEDLFTECYELISELFQKYPSEVCKKRNEAYSTLTNLFRVYAPKIVKSCFEVILSSRKILFVKKCGNVLRVLNNAGKTLIPENLEFTEVLICQAWEESPEKISSDQSVLENFKMIINAPKEAESTNVASPINSRLYSP